MAFRTRQYGFGFNLERPDWSALRFEALARRRGREITVIIKTRTGRDAYGNPVESEAEYNTRGFVEIEAKQAQRQLGSSQVDDLLIFLPMWAAAEPGWGLEIEGLLYRITSVERNQTLTKLSAERRAPA